MSEKQRPSRRFRWLWWTAGVFLLVLAALMVAGVLAARRTEPYLRTRIIETLSTRFHARVELDAFHVSLGNSLRGEWGVWAQGRGLRIWPPAEVEGVEVPNPAPTKPLVSLDSFGFHVPLRYNPDRPISIRLIRLQGLHITLPPKSHFLHLAPGDTRAAPPPPQTGGLPIRFELGAIDCKDTSLTLETSKPGKMPLEIDFTRLTFSNVTPDQPMRFEADLTNPKPTGIVHTKGFFGPWQVSDPGESPISGEYTFDNARLADFKGIAGTLSSTGMYQGTLRTLNVDGTAQTPDFSLTHFGNTMNLQTRFHAIVDATNGDTRLDPVNATLGHSPIVARGQVVRAFAGTGSALHGIGHDIELNVEVNNGRIEDFLRLASHDTTPLLTGNVDVKALLHIPPGKTPVHERMALKGQFTLDQAQFASDKVQQRIAELSLRGQGRPQDAKNHDHEDVQSTMQSDFTMASGVITLPNLVFTVPGADIDLSGTYKLEGGLLGFVGDAKMQATVSKMVGGWKGLLLKPADRFFKKDGAGTEVPIHIAGTYKNPEFGVDVKGIQVKPHTHPQRPDQPPIQAPTTASPAPPSPPPAGH